LASALAAASPSAVAQSGDSALRGIAQPFLNVSAGARYFECLTVFLEQDDMIGKSAEASQHHIFISGQCLAGTQRGLPLALQDRDIIEHFSIEFPRCSLRGNHDIPHNAQQIPRYPTQPDLRRCKNYRFGKPHRQL
jgi:hypothetical protein